MTKHDVDISFDNCNSLGLPHEPSNSPLPLQEHDSSHAMERLNIEKAIQKVNGSAAEPTTVTAVAQDTVPPKKTTEKEELEETKETGSAAQAQTTGAVAHKPRRRIRPVKAAAGAAMDMMKLTLERCGIGAVRYVYIFKMRW